MVLRVPCSGPACSRPDHPIRAAYCSKRPILQPASYFVQLHGQPLLPWVNRRHPGFQALSLAHPHALSPNDSTLDGKELAVDPVFKTRTDLDDVGRYSYRIVIAYDGTDFKGWQLQKSAPTVQQEMEVALMTITRESRSKLGVSAAGRTDAGVHARGQVVQFFTDKQCDVSKLKASLNGLLPHSIRALAVYRTAPDFHVTFSAVGKIYRYLIDTSWVHDPLTHRFRAHHRRPVNIPVMQQASRCFIGTHDFTQFSNHGVDTAKRNPVKTIQRVDVTEIERGLQVEVEGSGFLYRQVRHMVGALLAVGEGKLCEADLRLSLEVGASQLPGRGGAHRGWDVAPAKGLTLMQVHYPAAADDPDQLLYPDYPHDEWGRLSVRVAESEAEQE